MVQVVNLLVTPEQAEQLSLASNQANIPAHSAQSAGSPDDADTRSGDGATLQRAAKSNAATR